MSKIFEVPLANGVTLSAEIDRVSVFGRDAHPAKRTIGGDGLVLKVSAGTGPSTQIIAVDAEQASVLLAMRALQPQQPYAAPAPMPPPSEADELEEDMAGD